MRHPPATPVGSPTDGAPVGPPGTSSPPLGETGAQSSARHPTAVTGRRGGAVTAGRLGGAGGDPVAAGLEGQCALLTPASARNPAPGKLVRAFSRACAGGLFALKPGSWVDQRLVRERYSDQLSPEACALSLFLVTVADAQGLRFYSEQA